MDWRDKAKRTEEKQTELSPTIDALALAKSQGEIVERELRSQLIQPPHLAARETEAQ